MFRKTVKTSTTVWIISQAGEGGWSANPVHTDNVNEAITSMRALFPGVHYMICAEIEEEI